MKHVDEGMAADIEIMRELKSLSRGSYETVMDQFRTALRQARQARATQGDKSKTLKTG